MGFLSAQILAEANPGSLVVVCSWCEELVGIKDGEGVSGISHGLCWRCERKSTGHSLADWHAHYRERHPLRIGVRPPRRFPLQITQEHLELACAIGLVSLVALLAGYHCAGYLLAPQAGHPR